MRSYAKWAMRIALTILLVKGCLMNASAQEARTHDVAVYGHNGYFKEEAWPESSVEGFARMLELGADGCEIDLFRLADGNFIVYHDAEDKFALRALDGYGDIYQLDYPHVRAFNKAFYFLGEARDEPILLLEDMLALARETNMALVYDPKFLKHPNADRDLVALRDLTRKQGADDLVFWKKNAHQRLRELGADMQGARLLPPGRYYGKDDNWWRLYGDTTEPATRQVSVYFPTVCLDALERGPRTITFDIDAFRARSLSMQTEPAYPDAPTEPAALIAALESPDLNAAHAAFFHVRLRNLTGAAPTCMRILERSDKADRFARTIEAARTLGALKSREAVGLLTQTGNRKIDGAGAATLRGACAGALAVTAPNEKQTLDALATILEYPERNHFDAKFPKRVASDALRRSGEPGLTRLAMALSASSDQARLYASWALIRAGEDAMPHVRPSLETSASPLAQERAAWIAGWLRDKASLKALETLLPSPHEPARARAAWALGRIGAKRQEKTLREMLQSGPSPEVRAACEQALTRIAKTQ